MKTFFVLLVLISPFFASAQQADIVMPSRTSVYSDSVYSVVDIQPYFSGGTKGISEFIKENLVYPERALQSGIEGVVIVGFIVNEFGLVTNVEALKKVEGGCTEEAIRIVQKMPTWVAGQKDGKPVKVKVTLPIRFQLAH